MEIPLEGLELIDLFDQLNYWVFKMEKVGDTTEWRPREGYTFEECEALRNNFPKEGTLDDVRKAIREAQMTEGKQGV